MFATEHDESIQYVIDFMWCYKFAHGKTTRVNETQLNNSWGALLYMPQHSSVPKSKRTDYIFQFSWSSSSKLCCCPVKDTQGNVCNNSNKLKPQRSAQLFFANAVPVTSGAPFILKQR